MMIHNQKNPASVVISVSCSTLARIKQQYNMSTKRATKRKSTMMSVDDSVLTKFQTLLNDIFVNYDNYNLIMNSDTTRIQQSMAPTNVLTFKNKPANVDQGVATNQNKQPCGNTNVTNNITNYNTNNITNYNTINIFNIPNNDKPVRDTAGNRYTGTESGKMNNDELIKFIEDIIVEHTQDRPAAFLLTHLDINTIAEPLIYVTIRYIANTPAYMPTV